LRLSKVEVDWVGGSDDAVPAPTTEVSRLTATSVRTALLTLLDIGTP
jgi:hypothetical protein